MMRKDIGNIIRLSCIYVCVVLGAGFASGAELVAFFLRFGVLGLLGIIMAGGLLGLLGWSVMDLVWRFRCKCYHDLINRVVGPKIGFLMNIVMLLFVGALFCAMLAGAGAMTVETGIGSFSAGVIVMGILCFLVFLFDLNGIVRLNLILGPMLIVGGVILGLYCAINSYEPVFLNILPGPGGIPAVGLILCAVLYASYNSITSVTFLCEMESLVSSPRVAKWAGLSGGFAMALLGLAFSIPLLMDFEYIVALQIPMLYMAQKYGIILESLYVLLLLGAILTTAIGNGFALINRIAEKTGINPIRIKAALVLVGMILAHLGFSGFVEKIYPLFGYLGLFQLTAILLYQRQPQER